MARYKVGKPEALDLLREAEGEIIDEPPKPLNDDDPPVGEDEE